MSFYRKLIISTNNRRRNPINPINGVPQGSPLFAILILFVSDIPQPNDAQGNLSQSADDIAIWVQAPGSYSINLRLQKYLNQILTWCDKWRIKSSALYGQTFKINQCVKFLEVHLNMTTECRTYWKDIPYKPNEN